MKTIGSILLDVELVTQEDIERALKMQKQTGQRLGEILVNLGVVSDDDIRWALAEQLNLPYVNIRKDQIDTEIATLIPEKLARRYHVIPILRIEDELTIVVDDPLNKTIINDIETITKLHVKLSLGRTSDIMMAIDEIYGRTEETLVGPQEAPPHFLSPWFAEGDIQRILNDPSGYALLDSVLINAYAHGVSRIYFQPGLETHIISYRMHGVVQQQIELGKEWYSITMFRLKISAGFDISKVLTPQYREFAYWGHPLDQEPGQEIRVKIAVSIFPTTAGETATLLIIDKPVAQIKSLEQYIGLSVLQQHELQEIGMLRSAIQLLKTGAIFLTGASYPDKITTLYSLLQPIDPVRKKIMTFEAYTEYQTEQYVQIRYVSGDPWEISEKHLLTTSAHPYASMISPQQVLILDTANPDIQKRMAMSGGNPPQKVLSGWLSGLQKQDADVVLVDHIESDVVLTQCLDYAASQLMLSAFGFKHVFDLLAYCLDCQIPPAILTSRVYALLAQHTIFLLCQACKRSDTTDATKQMMSQFVEEGGGHPEIFAPVGCPACYGTGYTEAVFLFEMLTMEPWLKELLLAHAPLIEIRKTAAEKGFSSLKQKCVELLRTGQTSLEQVLALMI